MVSKNNENKTENTLVPFITVEDIMKVFSCKKDKAYEIMNNPDLKAFKVGKTYYVTKERWDTFINNLIKYNGLSDLSRGFLQ